MLKSIRVLIYRVMNWLDNIKGSRHYGVKHIHQHSSDGYLIIADKGFEIRLYCQERVYSCTFASKWVTDKELSVFTVYATCSTDTPQEIQDRFKSELTISTFLNSWSSKEAQKLQAIKAYVDMILKGDI